MNAFVLLGLLAIGSLVACSGDDPLSTDTTGEPVAKLTLSRSSAGGTAEPRLLDPIGHKETVLRFDKALQIGGLTLTLQDVQDSRCPDGAVCIWEGEVKLTVSAAQDGEELGSFELTQNIVERKKSVVQMGDYRVSVLVVQPYPVLGIEIARASYETTLVVERHAANLTVSARAAGGFRGELPRVKPPLGEPPLPPLGETLDYARLTELLGENRTKWQTQGATEYAFTFSRSCFCPPDYTRAAGLTVSAGRIIAANYVDDGAAVAAEVIESYKTINELFAAIEEAIATGAAQIDAEFDEELGFPKTLYIDQDVRIADEEAGYSAGEVVLAVAD